MASTCEGRFTVLPFIAANGQPVCCVVIFQLDSPEPKMEWGKGIDIKVEPVRQNDGEIDLIASCGTGKHYPGGPSTTIQLTVSPFVLKVEGLQQRFLSKYSNTLMTAMFFLKSLEVRQHFSS